MRTTDAMAGIGVAATWRLAQSALPTAPVVVTVERTPGPLRVRAAHVLRRAAAALEQPTLRTATC